MFDGVHEVDNDVEGVSKDVNRNKTEYKVVSQEKFSVSTDELMRI